MVNHSLQIVVEGLYLGCSIAFVTVSLLQVFYMLFLNTKSCDQTEQSDWTLQGMLAKVTRLLSPWGMAVWRQDKTII